jgi:hypothetical protein
MQVDEFRESGRADISIAYCITINIIYILIIILPGTIRYLLFAKSQDFYSCQQATICSATRNEIECTWKEGKGVRFLEPEKCVVQFLYFS